MDRELMHHGIKGMKWGVRRTPEQLGHVTNKGSAQRNLGEKIKNAVSKLPKKKKTAALTDEELRNRINRLNMEEQYSNLLARQKDRNTSSIAKKVSKALDSFGNKAFDYVVSKSFDSLFGDKKFDINDYKNADVNTMDAETITKVAKWYANASAITKTRESLKPSSPEKTGKEKKREREEASSRLNSLKD